MPFSANNWQHDLRIDVDSTMSGVSRFGRLLVASMCCILGVLAWLTPPSAFADVDPVPLPAPGSGLAFSLADMGATTPLAFYGDQGNAELTFPVPRGLTPLTLNATVELPVNVRSGTLTVMQKDRTISRVPLPPGDQAPIVIPLTGATVEDNSVTVTLRTYLLPVEGYCLDPTNPLRLVSGAVVFGGAEAAPTNVAEFLPPILRKLTIAIPAAPSRAESDAAVRLASAVTARYGQQPTTVVIASLAAPPPPAGPFERQILIRQGQGAGVMLQPVPGALPNLQISGPENDIVNQVRLLSANISRLALSSRAVVGPLSDSPQLPGDVTRLRALGQPVISAVGLSPQVSVGLDQTRIGRPVQSVRVNLKGSYTPPPAALSARLTTIVGGETIDSWATDDRGVIDRWISVPDRLLQRYTTMAVVLNLVGNTGRCGEFQPLTLTIDGDSIVQSAAAVPPVPAGLQSLPQALMPRTLIGVAEGSFDDTVRAVAIAVAMQRLSVRPIDTAVTSVEQALNSAQPAIVIAPDGWKYPSVTLPVTPDAGKLTLTALVGTGDSTTLTLDPELRYGTLQVVFDGRRTILAATSNGAPAQLDELLRWMSADPKRWSRLSGVAVVSAPGQEPVVVGPQPGVGAAVIPAGTERWAWVVGGSLVAVAAALTGLIALRGRRTPAGEVRGD